MSATKVDTSYRNWSFETLEAVKTSTLIQLKQIEATGQTHSVSGRQTALATHADLVQTLTNIESALAWKRNPANFGNSGFASRYSNFGC